MKIRARIIGALAAVLAIFGAIAAAPQAEAATLVLLARGSCNDGRVITTSVYGYRSGDGREAVAYTIVDSNYRMTDAHYNRADGWYPYTTRKTAGNSTDSYTYRFNDASAYATAWRITTRGYHGSANCAVAMNTA